MRLSLLLVIFSGTVALMGQERHEFWSKLYVKHDISKHWAIASDIQYRTQGNYHQNHSGCFDHYKMQSGRLWMQYALNSSAEILLSPIAYFRTSDLLPNSDDWGMTNEIRLSAGLQKTQNFKTFSLKWRFLTESRHFIYPIRTQQYRSRLQMQIKIPVIKKKQTEVGVVITEEYFYKLFEKMDNNRVFSGLSLRLNQQEIQTGFQWQQQGSFKSGVRILQFVSTINVTF
ncbi:MAG: DUF2490 domain-containing protein [Chitinophagaceae bacterium]